MDAIAPQNAPSDVAYYPKNDNAPVAIASTAPHDAPEEIPSTYGLARGFFVKACIATPETLRQIPTNTPSRTLGALKNHTIFCVLLEISEISPIPNIL